MKKIDIEKFLIDSAITKDDIINYYKDHLLNECAEFFNVNRKMMSKIFNFYNIEKRSKSETNLLISERNKLYKLNNYLKYIDKNTFKYLYYENNINDCLTKLNIDTYEDLMMLVDHFNLKRKTYKDRQKVIKKTLIENYGCDNVAKIDAIKNKISKSLSDKSLDEWSIIQSKIKKTKLERYGDENYNNKEKIKNTIINKYGSYEKYNLERKNKSIATNNARYGCDWYMQTNSYKESYKSTCLNKYCCEYYCQSNDYIKKGRKKYFYDDNYFDSSWELALWIYAKDHNEEIIRLPIKLAFLVNDVTHYYFPDFKYKNELIEIKGPHMLDKNNNLINAYNTNVDEQYFIEKQKCMNSNNVKLYTKNDLKFAFDYCKNIGINFKDYKI